MTSPADSGARRYHGLRLVVAPPGAGPGGLPECFIAEVRRLRASAPLRPIRVVVGSNVLKLHLSRVLAERLGGHANVTFVLLKDIARSLGSPRLLDRGRARLPERGRELLLEEAVAAHSHGSYFRDIAAKEGFIEALSSTVRELKEAEVDPSLLRAAAAGVRRTAASASGQESRAGKLEDLATLCEAYAEMLIEKRLYDDEDLIRSAGLQADEPRGRDEVVLVYGFYDANWGQRRLLQSYLAFRSGAVFVPFEKGEAAGAYAYATPMLEWLSGWIRERQEPAAAAPARSELELMAAPGEAREAAEAVRWLVSQARERSVPFGRMALLYRSTEPYLRLVAEMMAQAGGVPRYLADGVPLSMMPAARGLTLLLRARDEDLSRRSVIDLLGVGPEAGRAAVWDRLTAGAGIVRGLADWRSRLSSQARSPGDPSGAALLLREVQDLHEGLAALSAAGSWRGFAEAVFRLMGRFLPGVDDLKPVEELVLGLGALDAVSTPVEPGRFLAVLRRAIQEKSARRSERTGEFQESGIFVGSVMEARLLGFDAVAIVGLVEGAFPAPARQDPILLDDERAMINSMVGPQQLPLKSERLHEERLLFRLACLTSSGGLLLSYPRLDPATARPRLASPFLLRAAEAIEATRLDYETLESLPRMRRIALSDLSPATGRAILLSREFDLLALRAAREDDAARRRAASLLHHNPILHRALLAEESRWGETRFTPWDGVILRPGALDTLRRIHPVRGADLSASRIERYAACPLSYFMSEVLRLAPLEEPEQADRLDPRRRGALVHRILEDLFKSMQTTGLLPLRPARKAEALAILKEVAAARFAEEESKGLTGYALLWKLDRESILEDLGQVVAAEAESAGDFVPAYFERGFERVDPGPGLAGPAGLPTLRGVIDRIDLSPDGSFARVTDYKTGTLEGYQPDRLQGGTTVQLPLYMLAAEQDLGREHPGLRVESGRYLSVDRRGGFREVAFSAEALQSGRADLARVVTTFAQGVERGAFFAHPAAEVCRRCDFRLACGEGRQPRFERKREDPTAADYLRMRAEVA